MENNIMIYTAIYQGAQGQLYRTLYTGVMDRKDAWLTAMRLAASAGECLIALVSGDHPVYFYEDFVEDNAARGNRTLMQNHDLFEIA